MRFFIVLVVLLLLVFKLWPEQPVPTAEESFIGPQLEPLNKAQAVEQQYMDALEAKNQHIEEQIDDG